MKNKNLIILALIGLGIYWYMRKKPPVVANKSTVAPDTSNVVSDVASADVNIKFAINGLKKFGNVPNTI
jgi:hypothetical protein